jgi:hypothetical protein
MEEPSYRALHQRLDALTSIWQYYDQWSGKAQEWACREHCATCCTCNVTVTTLEGFWMVSKMAPAQLKLVEQMLDQVHLPGRFRPLITTNGIAEKCIAGEQWPEDADQLETAPCPLLGQDNTCSLYALRPFGCRCLLSIKNCRVTGHAEMDSWILTLNHAVLQIIEHLDHRGYTGNLIDMLRFMTNRKARQAYSQGERIDPVSDLIPNRPLKMLLIPPEHREKLAPFLRQLEPLLARI